MKNFSCSIGGWLVLLLALGVGGCLRAPAQLELHPALGEVRSAGRPAPGVHITLYPTPETQSRVGALRPHAQADGSGKFTLGTYVQDDGAPQGEWLVTLTWPDDRLSPAVRDEILANGDALPDRLQGRYASPTASSLRFTIGPGSNRLPPIELP
jgi:hypothetical protein